MDFTNGSYIQALPCSPDRLRGFTADHIYCDEAAHFLSDEALLRIFKPMLGPKAGGLSLVSTPAGKRVDSMFYSQYMLASEHPIPGVREKFDFVPSTLSPLITQEFLERERKSYAMGILAGV